MLWLSWWIYIMVWNIVHAEFNIYAIPTGRSTHLCFFFPLLLFSAPFFDKGAALHVATPLGIMWNLVIISIPFIWIVYEFYFRKFRQSFDCPAALYCTVCAICVTLYKNCFLICFEMIRNYLLMQGLCDSNVRTESSFLILSQYLKTGDCVFSFRILQISAWTFYPTCVHIALELLCQAR